MPLQEFGGGLVGGDGGEADGDAVMAVIVAAVLEFLLVFVRIGHEVEEAVLKDDLLRALGAGNRL